MSETSHAIVLAGGRGRRMAPYTSVLPKPLLPIGEVPILEVLLRQLSRAGITNIHLAVGYLSQLIQSYFGDGTQLGVTIHYYREPEPLGTAGPVRFVAENWKASEPMPECFLVMNGDLLMDVDFGALVDRHQPGSLTILVARKEVHIDLGVLEIDGQERVCDYIEKPVHDFRVSTGVYVFSRNVVDQIPAQVAYDLPDLVKAVLRTDLTVRPVRLEEVGSVWLDLGRPEDYEVGRQMFDENPDRFCSFEPHADSGGE